MNVFSSTVWKLMDKYNFPRRSLSEAVRLNPPVIEYKYGSDNHAWKGDLAITPLYILLRSSELYKNWRTSVFIRDNRKCVLCGENKNIQADHIKPFAIIFYENNISSKEQAFNCKELFDTKNGRTLCKSCHKKTDTYGQKTKKLLEEIRNNI